jgi:electron transfer flavoprotein beta subunit
MRFLVCIKQVVDSSKMVVDPDTGRLNRNNANSILNPCDRNALEAALELREQEGGTVSVITMGPPQAAAVLREAASMGADDLYLVTDRAFGGADTLATSYTLVSAIREMEPFDMIFCGQESIDSNTAQVGPEMAAMLGIPNVSAATGSLSLSGQTVTVTRHMGKGAEVVEMKLPCLITTAPELNEPRYPSIRGLIEKDNREIHSITSKDVKVDPARIGVKGSPTQVKRVRPVVPAKKENLKIACDTAAESAHALAAALQKIRVI